MGTISKSIRGHFFIAEKRLPAGRIWPRDSQAGSKKGHFWTFFSIFGCTVNRNRLSPNLTGVAGGNWGWRTRFGHFQKP